MWLKRLTFNLFYCYVSAQELPSHTFAVAMRLYQNVACLHCVASICVANWYLLHTYLHRPHLIDVPDQYGYSPLMVTCHHGNLDLVDYLLHTGANVEFQNANGRTRWAQLVMHYSLSKTYSKLPHQPTVHNICMCMIYVAGLHQRTDT